MKNKVIPYEFKSVFAEDINFMFKYRLANGFCNRNITITMTYFDQFCVETGITEPHLTEKVVYDWFEWETKHGRIIYYNKVSDIRCLAKCMNGTGKDACIVETAICKNRPSKTQIIPDDEHLLRLFEAIDTFSYKANRDIFAIRQAFPALTRLTYACGLRPGETLNLRRKDINYLTGEIFIADSKGHKDRIVVAKPDVVEMIRQYDYAVSKVIPNSEFLFVDSNGVKCKRYLVNRWLNLCWQEANPETPKEELQRITLYMLRHLFATSFLYARLKDRLSGGVKTADLDDLAYLRLYMGHKSIDSTLYYAHLVPGFLPEGSLEASMEEINARLPL